MRLEQSFEVAAPVERVWTALLDIEQVAPCLPGAAITGQDEAGVHQGTFQVKLGPTTANYRGTIRIESADEATRTATLAARGSDRRGQGGATATIVSRLVAVDGGTRVDTETDYTITGKLATFGRGGMIRDISTRLLREFSTCLAERLAQGGEAATPAAAAGVDAAPDSPAPAAPAGATSSAAPPPYTEPGRAPAAPAPAPASPPAATPPIKGFSLILSVLWERIRGLAVRRRGS